MLLSASWMLKLVVIVDGELLLLGLEGAPMVLLLGTSSISRSKHLDRL